MKKIVLFLFIALTYSSVNLYSQTLISGKVAKGIVNGKAILYEINDNGGLTRLDSTIISPDLSFKLSPKILQGGGFYQLELNKQQKLVLILEGNERLNVVADGIANGKAQVTGSKNMEYYKKVTETVQAMKVKSDVWETQFKDAVDKKDNVKQESIRKEFMVAQDATIAKIKSFFPEMGTNLVALFATNYLNPTEEVPFLNELVAKFEKTNSKNKQILTFISKVKKMGGTSLGAPAPEIALKTPAGDTLSLSALRGKYVLIDFWASWCGPCRRENPNVVLMYNKFKDKGFEIYGVSLDNNYDAWLKAIDKDKLKWKHVSDLLQWQSSVVGDYQIQGIPQTYLLDKEGKIIAKNLRGQSLEAKLTEIFGN
jgi:peroxiredoxin